MADHTETSRPAGIARPRDRISGEPAAPLVASNLAFDAFSKAFDDVAEARRAVEKYGVARLANPPAPQVVAAQRKFDDAVNKYNAIVAALIKPKF